MEKTKSRSTDQFTEEFTGIIRQTLNWSGKIPDNGIYSSFEASAKVFLKFFERIPDKSRMFISNAY